MTYNVCIDHTRFSLFEYIPNTAPPCPALLFACQSSASFYSSGVLNKIKIQAHAEAVPNEPPRSSDLHPFQGERQDFLCDKNRESSRILSPSLQHSPGSREHRQCSLGPRATSPELSLHPATLQVTAIIAGVSKVLTDARGCIRVDSFNPHSPKRDTFDRWRSWSGILRGGMTGAGPTAWPGSAAHCLGPAAWSRLWVSSLQIFSCSLLTTLLTVL